MNFSKNETYLNLDYWLNLISTSSIIFEILNTYTIIPISIVAIWLNVFTLWILKYKEFKSKKFFSFMKAYVANNIFLCLFVMTSFVASAKRLFVFATSYEAAFYCSYFYGPVLAFFYLNSSLLEIFLVIERSVNFLPIKYKKLNSIGFKKICIFIIITSLAVCLPTFFVFYPGKQPVRVNEVKIAIIYYTIQTSFAVSSYGSIILFLVFFIRDFLTMFIKIVLNAISVSLIRNYMNKLNMEKQEFAQQISMVSFSQNTTSVNVNQTLFISKANKKQTYIAVIMSIISILEHLFYITSYIFYSVELKMITPTAYYLALISFLFKSVISAVARGRPG